MSLLKRYNYVARRLHETATSHLAATFLAIQPNSVVHNNNTYGVLKLVLHQHSTDYRFVRDPTSGLFSDSGTVTCH